MINLNNYYMNKNFLFACVAIVGAAYTPTVSVQAQQPVPYTVDFGQSQDGWTSINQLATGGKTWEAKTKSHGFYDGGTYYDCVGLSSTFTPNTNAWYVSPSISLEAGKTYEVKTFAARNSQITLTLNIGTSADDMTSYTSVGELSPLPTTHDASAAITKEVTVDASGDFHFALNATTTENYAPYDCNVFTFSVVEKGTAEPEKPLVVTSFPYVADLTASNEGWTACNYNNDDDTWMFFSGAGVGMASTLLDADDAYVSPAIQLTKGCKYKVATNVQLYGNPSDNYHMTLTVGKGEGLDKEAFVPLKLLQLTQLGYNVDEATFEPSESGVYRFAFLNTTTADYTNSAVIVTAFGIDETKNETVETGTTVFSDDFSAADAMGKWTVADANHDGVTWGVSEGVSGITYDSGKAEAQNPANDWLFSPAVGLLEGQDYFLTYTVRRQGAFDDDVLSVAFGNAANAEAMTRELGKQTVSTNAEDVTTTMRITADQTGDAFFGFHVTTPSSDNGQLSLVNIELKAADKATPCAVENFTAKPSRKDRNVLFTWTNPVQDTNGIAINQPFSVRLYDGDELVACVDNQEAGKEGSYLYTPSSFAGRATYKAEAYMEGNASAQVAVSVNLDDMQGDVILVKKYDVDRQKAAEWVIDGKCQAWKYDYSDIFTYEYRKGTKVADEWLISPTVELEAGKHYMLKYELKTSQDYGNNLFVTIGNAQTKEAQTKVLAEYYGLEQNGFAEYQTEQFTLDEDGSYSIGFHVTNSNYYVNMRNLRVYHISETTGIEAVEGNASVSRVCVYDASGRLISDKAASSVDEAVKALGKGMYVVKAIGTDGKTSAIKVIK